MTVKKITSSELGKSKEIFLEAIADLLEFTNLLAHQAHKKEEGFNKDADLLSTLITVIIVTAWGKEVTINDMKDAMVRNQDKKKEFMSDLKKIDGNKIIKEAQRILNGENNA